MRKNKHSIRSLTAFIVTWAFIVLMVTGLVLYVVPHGRVAYWVQWSLAGMEKDQWAWVHMIFGGIFIVAGILHLYFNWKPFKQYLAERVKGHLALKQEVIVATLATVVIFLLAVFDLPPASWIIDLNARLKDSWVSEPSLEPPFGHAERASLAGISKRMDLDLDKALEALRVNDIAFDGPRDTLEAIARRNEMTPMAVYALISRHEKVPDTPSTSMTAAEIEARYMGTGLGRKAISVLCQTADLEVAACLERLSDAGIAAAADDTVRAVAEAHGRRPMDLLLIVMQGAE
jgi:hypothetical protein